MNRSQPESFDVPAIDISAYVSGGGAVERERVAREVDAACARVGFMQVRGHGIPDEVIAGLAGAIDEFFASPAEFKNSYRVVGANRGYSPPRSEALSLSLGIESATRMNDFFEAFNVGAEARWFPELALSEDDYGLNVWPDLAGFQAAAQTYYGHAARVARTLTTIFAAALGLEPDFFARLTDHSIDVLRMNNYALPPGTRVGGGELIGMGEHTDFGIVTVLWADRIAGLQVLGADSRWHDVVPEPGALLVNLGDLTARLTNDRWLSTLHRVRPPVVDGTIRRRRSAAFFHDGNVDAVIATLPDHIDADGSAYEPILVRDHIRAKLAGSRHGRRNRNAGPEAARVRAARESPSDGVDTLNPP
ncbi:isopenicillin N synthase family oxygenase [Nocardia sp. CDC159]|uniref:Isopenicillin N synthase family oxygenase n=1 Tax=Nocardia pulmonis TaxID=2951408 RepID=A0A9X2EDW6_9NOCA|nr:MULTISPECIES: 2-oxoglutarate and iron-dependent oxygenase domain-containing protein [Nocardia]MCM6776458.1 isopenicillin N synthase family oxygenase [Nocardia pulmonis]MCM6788882.1 isopenicillin N synthase family oxygenase [Nocardia sp. CDC159]